MLLLPRCAASLSASEHAARAPFSIARENVMREPISRRERHRSCCCCCCLRRSTASSCDARAHRRPMINYASNIVCALSSVANVPWRSVLGLHCACVLKNHTQTAHNQLSQLLLRDVATARESQRVSLQHLSRVLCHLAADAARALGVIIDAITTHEIHSTVWRARAAISASQLANANVAAHARAVVACVCVGLRGTCGVFIASRPRR